MKKVFLAFITLISIHTYSMECITYKIKDNSILKLNHKGMIDLIKSKTNTAGFELDYFFDWKPSHISTDLIHNCPEKVYLSVNEGMDTTSNTVDIFYLNTSVHPICFYTAKWSLDDKTRRVACLK